MSQDNKNSNSPSNSSTPNAEEQGKQQGKIVKQGILWKEGLHFFLILIQQNFDKNEK